MKVEELIEQLASDDDAQRSAAAHVLADLGAPAVAPLIALLADPDWEMRIVAAGVLAQIGDPHALPALRELHRADTDYRVDNAIFNAIQAIEVQEHQQS